MIRIKKTYKALMIVLLCGTIFSGASLAQVLSEKTYSESSSACGVSGIPGVASNTQIQATTFNSDYPPSQNDSKTIHKKIDIFCKVLDHQLKETLGNDYISHSLLSGGCQGYWIPVTGVLVTLNVNFPLLNESFVEEKIHPKDKPKKVDLWDQYENPQSTMATQNVESIMHIEAVESEKATKLKESVKQICLKYAERFGEFKSNVKLIIIVNGQRSLKFNSNQGIKVTNLMEEPEIEVFFKNEERKVDKDHKQLIEQLRRSDTVAPEVRSSIGVGTSVLRSSGSIPMSQISSPEKRSTMIFQMHLWNIDQRTGEKIHLKKHMLVTTY